MPASFAPTALDAVPIHAVDQANIAGVVAALAPATRAFIAASDYEPKPGRHLVLPAPDGGLAGVLFGLLGADQRGYDPFLIGRLPAVLPGGRYRLAGAWPSADLASLGWALSSYRFTRYKEAPPDNAVLCLSPEVDHAGLARIVEGVTLARDLVNTPANDLGPDALEAAVVALAGRYGAVVRTIRDAALKQGFPLIHAVGLAAAEAPRLVDLTWGPRDAPKVTLVGKGVTFDTGGLDIKAASAMGLMKKDMGGAATAIALAQMIMDAGLSIRLRLLVPIVENAIAAASFRPGDIYRSRKGLTVEIGNTDAEGRLILADALCLACEDKPDLLLDFATLTGAARVALGPDLPPFYTDDDALADAVASACKAVHDPAWRMPLWPAYDALLDGKISDLNNITGGPFAGSVTAALFLRRFVEPGIPWVHFDIYGWNPTTRPGRPEGGETQTARALFALLSARYPA